MPENNTRWPNVLGGTVRVLVGDSVYENADVTVHDGRLHIEFEADDLDSIMLDLRGLYREDECSNS